MSTLVHQEFSYALRQGLVAAALVFVVLVTGQMQAWIIAVSMAGAVVLGVGLHLTVLVVGLTVRRLLVSNDTETESAPEVA